MTSSKTFKKIVSIGAALMLALGGSLVATQPASAATPTAVPVLSSGIGFDIKTTTVSVDSAATFTGGSGDTSTNYWLVCGVYAVASQYEWSANGGPNQTFGQLTSGNCKIALSGNSLADAITASTLTFSDVTHLYDSSTSTAAATVAGSLVDKYIVRYESLVAAGTVTAWAASMPSMLRGAVTTNPGVTGTATSGGSINLNSAIVWSSTPASTSYYLMQCDAVRNSGTELGEVNIPTLWQNSQLACAPWAVSNNPVVYSSLPISLPSGLTAGKYLAIMISGNRTNYVTSSLTSAYSAGGSQQNNNNQSLYRVTLHANGGTLGTTTFVDQVVSGEQLTLPNPSNVGAAPTRNGYTLSGWSTNMISTVGSYTATPTTNSTYFAIWTSSSSNNNNSYGTVVSNPATPTISNGVATATGATWAGASVNKRAYWLICDNVYSAQGGANSSMRPADCKPFALTAQVNVFPTWVGTNPLTIPATLHKLSGVCTQSGCTTAPVETAGKYLVWYEVDNNWTMSATVLIGAASASSTDSTEVTDVAAAPLPVWASNIISSIPTLTKSLVTTGGSVALSGGDYTDLKSVTIGGKAVAFKIETTGNVNIPVPAGEAGKTADIVIVFGGGTMTVQDGIKYVAQVDVAKVAERPIAIAAGAKKITEAIADQIRQAAFANPKNTHIQCVAYAANSSAKAQAAAKLTAVQACGIAAKANPALKIGEVTVVVNKLKARTAAVGVKVYKQN